MIDTFTISRELPKASIPSAHAEAIATGVQQAVDLAPCTRLDPIMPPTSFDIGFSLNPCPRR